MVGIMCLYWQPVAVFGTAFSTERSHYPQILNYKADVLYHHVTLFTFTHVIKETTVQRIVVKHISHL